MIMENRLNEIRNKINDVERCLSCLREEREQLEKEYNNEYDRQFELAHGISKGDTVEIDGKKYVYCGFAHHHYNRPFKVRKFNKDGKPSKAECFVWRDISMEIKKAENK